MVAAAADREGALLRRCLCSIIHRKYFTNEILDPAPHEYHVHLLLIPDLGNAILTFARKHLCTRGRGERIGRRRRIVKADVSSSPVRRPDLCPYALLPHLSCSSFADALLPPDEEKMEHMIPCL